jgi:hypothetical protein
MHVRSVESAEVKCWNLICRAESVFALDVDGVSMTIGMTTTMTMDGSLHRGHVMLARYCYMVSGRSSAYFEMLTKRTD